MVLNIIFDLDNTLVRCSEYYLAAYDKFANLVSTRTGIDPKIAMEIVKAVDLSGIKIDGFGRTRFPKSFEATSLVCDVLMDKQLDLNAAEESWNIGNDVFEAPYPLYDGVWDALLHIKREDYGMFICTKGDPHVQRRKLVINNLFDIFDEKHVYIDVFKTPEHFLRIIDEQDLDPDETICVGDSLKDDIGSAHKAGLKAVWVEEHQNKGWAYESEEHTPEWIIPTVRELPRLLSSLDKVGVL